MKSFITISMGKMADKLDPNKRKFCFEIFGFDFMIDAFGQLWLIEINTNPCLEESNELLESLVPRMIHDACKLTIDVMFPPSQGNIDHFPVKNYSNDEVLWEKLGNLNERAVGAFNVSIPTFGLDEN